MHLPVLGQVKAMIMNMGMLVALHRIYLRLAQKT
jgi:hypothetical protein